MNNIFKAVYYQVIGMIIFILPTCHYAVGQAQESLAGYYISAAGDTLRGTFSRPNAVGTPRSFGFYRDNSNESSQISPGDASVVCIRGVGVFVSDTVDVDYSPVYLTSLRKTSDPDIKREAVFLESLRTGRLSLYKLALNDGKQLFFVRKEGGETNALIDYYYLSEAKESEIAALRQDTKVHLARYKGQLNYLISDYPALQSKIERLRYNAYDLSRFVDDYNTYFSPELFAGRKPERIEHRFGLTAGTGLGKLSYAVYGGGGYDYGTDIPARVGAFWEFASPRYKKRLKLQNMLSLDWFSATAEGYYSYTPSKYHDRLYFSPLTLMLTNNLKFCLPGGKVTWYATGGITNSYIVHARNELIRETTLNQSTTTTYHEAVKYLEKYNISYTAGLGAETGKMAFELRFDPGKAYTKMISVDVHHNALLFLVSLYF